MSVTKIRYSPCSPCCDTHHTQCVTVVDPCGNLPVANAGVVIETPDGQDVIASGVTDSGGQFCFELPIGSSAYIAVVTPPSDTHWTGVTSTHTPLVLGLQSGWSCSQDHCCPPSGVSGPPYPGLDRSQTLTLSDGFGDVPMTLYGSGTAGYGIFSGCVTRNAALSFSDPCPTNFLIAESGSVPVQFFLTCGSPRWELRIATLGCVDTAFSSTGNNYPRRGTCSIYTFPQSFDDSYLTLSTSATCIPIYITFAVHFDNFFSPNSRLQQIYGNDFAATVTG